MKVFRNLVAIAGLIFCFASCSQHTTCAAYGASTYQINESPNELNVRSTDKNLEWMQFFETLFNYFRRCFTSHKKNSKMKCIKLIVLFAVISFGFASCSMGGGHTRCAAYAVNECENKLLDDVKEFESKECIETKLVY